MPSVKQLEKEIDANLKYLQSNLTTNTLDVTYGGKGQQAVIASTIGCSHDAFLKTLTKKDPEENFELIQHVWQWQLNYAQTQAPDTALYHTVIEALELLTGTDAFDKHINNISNPNTADAYNNFKITASQLTTNYRQNPPSRNYLRGLGGHGHDSKYRKPDLE